MKPHHPKGTSLRFTLLSNVALFLLATACSSSSSRRAIWLSEADLQACKAAALDAFAAGYTFHQRDENQPVLIRIDDWRVPIITVYLPLTEILPNSLTYAYYRFEGTERFTGRPELEAYALRERQVLKLVGSGLTSWGTGPLINRDVKLGDQ